MFIQSFFFLNHENHGQACWTYASENPIVPRGALASAPLASFVLATFVPAPTKFSLSSVTTVNVNGVTNAEKRIIGCYSLRPKLSTKSYFMKQKCQIQMGIVKCKNAATPLSTLGINTTYPHFQMRYIILF